MKDEQKEITLSFKISETSDFEVIVTIGKENYKMLDNEFSALLLRGFEKSKIMNASTKLTLTEKT